MKPAILLMASFLLVTPAARAEPRAGRQIPKLVVGTVFPMSGPQAVYGKEALRGIELALAQLREKEPDLAQHVSIVTADDRSTVAEAAAGAERLLTKDRAHVLIAGTSSASTQAMAAVAERHRSPLVAPLATTPATFGKLVFRTSFDEPTQGALLARALLDIGGGPRGDAAAAAVLRDANTAAEGAAARFAAELQAGGGKLAATEIFDLAAEDFAPHLAKLRAAKAKAVLLPASSATAGQVIQQAREQSVKLRFLGGDGWDHSGFAKTAGDGQLVLAHFAEDDPAPETQAFVAAFKRAHGRAPGGIAALAYDAMGVTLDAWKRVGSNLKDQLALGLQKTQGFAGATGTLSFDERGEPVKSAVVKETRSGGLRFKARVTAVTAAPATPAAAPAKP